MFSNSLNFRAPWQLALTTCVTATLALGACGGSSPISDEPADAVDAGTVPDMQQVADPVGRPRFNGGDSSDSGVMENNGGAGGASNTGGNVANADAGGLPPLITMDKACGMVAEAACKRVQTCTPHTLAVRFGSMDACLQRSRAACVADTGAEDSGANSVSLIRCAQAFSDFSCEDLAAKQLPSDCRIVGKRANGNPCGASVQCQSGYCAGGGSFNGREAEEGCGICVPRGAMNAECENNRACMPGLACNRSGKCVRPGGLNDACDGKNRPCQGHLACIEGRCRKPLAAGTPCGNSLQCNLAGYQVCQSNPNAGDDVLICGAGTPIEPGKVCAEGGILLGVCAGGIENCVGLGGDIAKCAPLAGDGQACGEAADGTRCKAPARCIAGKCRLGAAKGC